MVELSRPKVDRRAKTWVDGKIESPWAESQVEMVSAKGRDRSTCVNDQVELSCVESGVKLA